METQISSQEGDQSGSLASDFNTGNLVKELDQNDVESNAAQSTNNVNELATDEDGR